MLQFAQDSYFALLHTSTPEQVKANLLVSCCVNWLPGEERCVTGPGALAGTHGGVRDTFRVCLQRFYTLTQLMREVSVLTHLTNMNRDGNRCYSEQGSYLCDRPSSLCSQGKAFLQSVTGHHRASRMWHSIAQKGSNGVRAGSGFWLTKFTSCCSGSVPPTFAECLHAGDPTITYSKNFSSHLRGAANYALLSSSKPG